MKFKYETIFKKLSSDGNIISLQYKDCINEFLSKNSDYASFAKDKESFLNIIKAKYESKYNSIYKEGFSLYICFLFNNDFIKSNQNNKFKKEEQEIKTLYSTFILSKYSKIKKELYTYILNEFSPLKKLISHFSCNNNLLKIELPQILDLYDDIYLKIYLKLDNDLKDKLINKVKYDSHDSCYGFINPEIYSNDKLLFYALTDKDIYYWL